LINGRKGGGEGKWQKRPAMDTGAIPSNVIWQGLKVVRREIIMVHTKTSPAIITMI